MFRLHRSALAILLCFASAAPALAQDGETGGPPAGTLPGVGPAVVRPERPRTHRHQFGIRLGVAMPYVFAIKYGTGPACDTNPSDAICHRFGAALFDVDLSFAPSAGFEVTALGRIGFAHDSASGGLPLALGLGVRAFPSANDVVKPSIAGRLMLDFTSSSRPGWKSVDVGARGEFGLQIDPAPYFGLYAQIGVTLTVLRGLWFEPDIGAGAQVRFP